jgi:hypothetical protein
MNVGRKKRCAAFIATPLFPISFVRDGNQDTIKQHNYTNRFVSQHLAFFDQDHAMLLSGTSLNWTEQWRDQRKGLFTQQYNVVALSNKFTILGCFYRDVDDCSHQCEGSSRKQGTE